MGDVLLVICGGGANAAVGNSDDLMETTSVVLSKSEQTIPLDDEEWLRRIMNRYRIIIPFCILGGDMTDKVRTVTRCARDNGCKVVPVLGLPWEWETDRRQRATASLPDIVSLSDCSLVFDMDKITNLYLKDQTRRVDLSIRMADRLVMSSMNTIIECMEGPFFSTFTEKLYVFASNKSVLLKDAIDGAWDLMLFEKESIDRNPIVVVGSRVTSAEIEEIKSGVAMICGAVPDVLKRKDGDNRVDVFKPVKSF